MITEKYKERVKLIKDTLDSLEVDGFFEDNSISQITRDYSNDFSADLADELEE